MSAVNRATKGARRGPSPSTRRPRMGVVTIAWTVSRDAASGPWAVSPGEGEVELRWSLDLDAGTCRCVVTGDPAELLLGEGSASGTVDADLIHIQASAGAAEFAASLRKGQVLYARTNLLSLAGIAGGRYEVVR